MTVAELKRALEGVSDDSLVEIPVCVRTQGYPVVYTTPFEAQNIRRVSLDDSGTFRLYISLGEGVTVSKRKRA